LRGRKERNFLTERSPKNRRGFVEDAIVLPTILRPMRRKEKISQDWEVWKSDVWEEGIRRRRESHRTQAEKKELFRFRLGH